MITYDSFFDTDNKNKCTGCGVCVNFCPKNCITMKKDELGFIYPELNQQDCIDCKLCRKVCHLSNTKPLQNDYEYSVYYGKSKYDLSKSSSGGIFFEVAKSIISQGGVVVGAVFDENYNVRHHIATKIVELEKMQGSKYVQSNTFDILDELRQYLQEGVSVLFTGTPCQVSAIKKTYGNYENLFTIDLICHGVPSEKMWQDYLNTLNIGNIKKIEFRNKEKSGWGNCLKVEGNKGIKYYDVFESSYYYFFESNYSLRNCCYECQYSNMLRVGDLTLGDYWGVERFEDITFDEYKEGISLVICNSLNGSKLLHDIDSKILLKEISTKSFLVYNDNLRERTPRPCDLDLFIKDYEEKGYAYVENKYFKSKSFLKNKIIRRIPKRIKYLLKKEGVL